MTEKFKLPRYRASQNTKTHSLRFTSANIEEGSKANLTEHLDDQSTRYLLAGAEEPQVQIDSDSDKSPVPQVNKSLRESLASSTQQSDRKKRGGKSKPYMGRDRSDSIGNKWSDADI